jgi:hypothetical protein
MKNHVQEKHYVDLEGPLVGVISHLEAQAEGLVNPYLEGEYVGYDGGREYYVVGWRPMTEKELAKAKAERKREREAAKARRAKIMEEEKAVLERLAAKHGVTIVSDSDN